MNSRAPHLPLRAGMSSDDSDKASLRTAEIASISCILGRIRTRDGRRKKGTHPQSKQPFIVTQWNYLIEEAEICTFRRSLFGNNVTNQMDDLSKINPWMLEDKDAPTSKDPLRYLLSYYHIKFGISSTKTAYCQKKMTYCVTMNARIQVIFSSITSVCIDLTQTSWLPLRACVSCKCEKIFLRACIDGQNTMCAACFCDGFLQDRLELAGCCTARITVPSPTTLGVKLRRTSLQFCAH